MSYYYYNWQKSNIVDADDGPPLFAGSVAIVVMRMRGAESLHLHTNDRH